MENSELDISQTCPNTLLTSLQKEWFPWRSVRGVMRPCWSSFPLDGSRPAVQPSLSSGLWLLTAEGGLLSGPAASGPPPALLSPGWVGIICAPGYACGLQVFVSHPPPPLLNQLCLVSNLRASAVSLYIWSQKRERSGR